MKNKIMKRDTLKIQYYALCPKCKLEIKGTSQTQVKYCLKLHLEKHKKDERKNN